MSHILVLGGDGYLGWPTAMYYSMRGHQVTVVDNYFRRNACIELDAQTLYPVLTLTERANTWYQLTGYEIKVVVADLSEPDVMRQMFDGRVEYRWAVHHKFSGLPEVVIHFAEQPSAPYSLLDYRHADTTIVNNLRVTNNLLWAVRDFSRETHIIKLGTMGEYGTPNIDIEEGWLEIHHNNRKDTFLFPRQANSLYHTTKIMDTDLMWFGVRTWGLRITDLMQGPVYGLETDESLIDERLRTIFNYDEIFGTVINRFIVQAIAGHPLTVYGSGGQTRGYINILDVMQCIFVASENPPPPGEMKIYNQITETFSVNQLAGIIRGIGVQRGLDVKIDSLPNPRKEAEFHYYNPSYSSLQKLGVIPHLLDSLTLNRIFDIVEQFVSQIRGDIIYKGIKW